MINPPYTRLHAGFSEWLRILNFDITSQRDMPKMLEEFLCYLETAGCLSIREIKAQHLVDYKAYLDHRPNRKWEGGLSKNYIRKQLQVIRKFSRYLTESGQESFAAKLIIKGKADFNKSVLTVEEVKRLYQATTNDIYGLRDKAMLALYYGCGLRRNEGVNINLTDLMLDKELLFVRKGKGYKERYVPLSNQSREDIASYLLYARPYLSISRMEEALLLNVKGKRLTGGTCYQRLQRLREVSNINTVVEPKMINEFRLNSRRAFFTCGRCYHRTTTILTWI